MYFDRAGFLGNYPDDLTASGKYIPLSESMIWSEEDGSWKPFVTVSGIKTIEETNRFETLFVDIEDVYLIGGHYISPLQEFVRHVDAVHALGDFTNISRWNRETYSGVVVGEVKDYSGDYPFDPASTFSGMLRHYSANDGFEFGSLTVRFDAERSPYVAHALYPAEGESSWIRHSTGEGWIQDAVEMLFVDKDDFGRILVSTTVSGLLILDTELGMMPSPTYEKANLSFIETSGVFVTDMDTLRIY
ncbi:hypothetical protein LCGC14_0482980 [marine sediment metagenome]|uniref:Uncharacterized protein n=1 Tax=marine sediment metagenome TaxID=412755 RepID=A0A0F9S8V4_9ZZZZ